MKRILLIILLSHTLLIVAAQPKMQATLKRGATANTLDIYLKSSASFSQKDEAATITIAIPSTVQPAPSSGSSGVTVNNTGVVSGITGLQPNFLVNNIGSTSREIVVTTQNINGISYYVYTIIFAGTAAVNHSWVANEEQLALSIRFDGCTSNCNFLSALLVNLPNGGLESNSMFYFQSNVLGDITNHASPFYENFFSGTITNGGSPGPFTLSFAGLATPFYPISSGADLASLSNWTTNMDGTAGLAPLNFTNENYLFEINRNASVTGTWILNGPNAQITNDATLTVSGTGRIEIPNASSIFDLNGDSVILKSDITGTASIGRITGTLANATNITVERFIPTAKRAWRLLTAPVTATTIKNAWQEKRNIASGAAATTEPVAFGTLITGGNSYTTPESANAQGYDWIGAIGTPSIRVYTGGSSGGNWASTLPTTSSINSREAYLLFVRGNRTITNTGSATATLRASGSYKNGSNVTIPSATTASHTVVGNPFPSNIDFESVYQSNNTKIKHRFWVWDANFGTYGAYKLVNYVSGTGSDALYEAIPYQMNNAGSPISPTNLKTIQSGQGFFVEPAAGGVINISEAHKVGNVPTTNVFRVGSNAQKLYINLNLSEANNASVLADGVQVKFDADFSAAIANEDIGKPANFDENLAVRRSNKNFIVEGRPLVSGVDTVYLNLWNTSERNYQFQIKTDNFSAFGLYAYLVDRFTKSRTPVNLNGNVTNVNFSVTADSASKATDRFMVVFGANSVLPVNFTNVKASKVNTDIKVDWNVATEVNIKNYEVEKSADGQRFETTASIVASGNNSYSWLDVKPFTGNNFYRIKAIGIDGETKYSGIVMVFISAKEGSINVFPNPLTGKQFNLQLNDSEAGMYKLRLTNSLGQLVLNQNIKHSGGTAIHLIRFQKQLPKGIYNLEITGPSDRKEIIQLVNNN